jgi:cystathionine beta-synthase
VPLPPISPTILDAIGNTPMVRINRLTAGVIKATVLVKLETFNPGNSIKDRMAVRMIEDAERSGKLKPGGTIIEGTSGNTGMGLAIAAVVKGYKCIFTTTDKQSKEKVDALKAFGAEVIVCPTNVEPEDPRSYYSVSSRLEREVPNSWKANQYDNLSNTAAHYESTGLWLGLQEVQRDRHLRQERDLPVHHRGHRRGFPAGERRLQRDRRVREGHRQGRGADDAANRA